MQCRKYHHQKVVTIEAYYETLSSRRVPDRKGMPVVQGLCGLACGLAISLKLPQGQAFCGGYMGMAAMAQAKRRAMVVVGRLLWILPIGTAHGHQAPRNLMRRLVSTGPDR